MLSDYNDESITTRAGVSRSHPYLCLHSQSLSLTNSCPNISLVSPSSASSKIDTPLCHHLRLHSCPALASSEACHRGLKQELVAPLMVYHLECNPTLPASSSNVVSQFASSQLLICLQPSDVNWETPLEVGRATGTHGGGDMPPVPRPAPPYLPPPPPNTCDG
ncbi:hypothetical protein PIB30_058524 [Stylosanthes scabra]|uniref:Uncharacterized protein n=1 Tax=Stylosanthes scabra TaxID=79078 RepID=A0ABU6ZIP3_9FABA|nr:hypothetical protein [Stylosanthes scabra]